MSFLVHFFQAPKSRILHFCEVGSLWGWQPFACSKRDIALSIISNTFFLQIAGFTSSQYPISLNLDSMGGILFLELFLMGPKH